MRGPGEQETFLLYTLNNNASEFTPYSRTSLRSKFNPAGPRLESLQNLTFNWPQWTLLASRLGSRAGLGLPQPRWYLQTGEGLQATSPCLFFCPAVAALQPTGHRPRSAGPPSARPWKHRKPSCLSSPRALPLLTLKPQISQKLRRI